MLVDLISRLPDFLNVLQSNLNKQLTLHELGQYGSTYWIDEFEQSSADIYKCTQITGRMVAPKIESLLVLTDSMLLVLTGKGKRLAQNQPLRLQHFSYLDEIVKIDEVTPKRYKFSFTNSKDITLDFEATQTKSMVMSLRNRMGLWKAEEEQTGSLTGCTALELQLKIEQMNGAPTNEVGTLRRRIDCLSDAIEMFSVKDTERCERYKTQLKRLLADPTTQATLFQGERLPHRKS